MRTENSTILCRDDCPIQVIPSRSSAENLPRGTPSVIPAPNKDGGRLALLLDAEFAELFEREELPVAGVRFELTTFGL